ncbi:MAG TPA: hypothetical protein VFH61_06890 [Thermoleophilia bacterium]|nr:hypothetical protein [Thermoleophilia bacterium]
MTEEVTNQITMIVPGRRSLGEGWSKVSIGHTADEITVEREDAPAPADGKTITVVAGPDAEYSSYILEAAYEKAAHRPPAELTAQEIYDATNEAWFAFLEDKARHGRGQTSIGAAGMFQRQRVHQNPETRSTMQR